MTQSQRPLFVPWLAAILAGAGAFALIVFAAALLDTARPGQDSVAPIVRPGRLLVPNTANATRAGEAMVITNRPGAALTILALGTGPFTASHYGRLVIDAEPLPAGLELALVWVRRDDPRRPHELKLDIEQGRVLAAALDRSPEWHGEIAFAGIGVKGVANTPWALSAVTLAPPGILATIADMRRDWTRFEPWDGRSINVLFGGREDQRLWLPPAVFGASLVGALVLWGVARRRGTGIGVLGLALPFLIGWFVIDLRWQRNLLEQAGVSWTQFAGRSWEERHLAMEDADLFRFIEAARARMPQHPVRVFATSDFEYFRRRAGYHLYPNNVLAYDWEDPHILKPGDFVFFFLKRDVRYDSGSRELIWSSGARVPANVVLAQRGAGMFEVRGATAP